MGAALSFLWTGSEDRSGGTGSCQGIAWNAKVPRGPCRIVAFMMCDHT